MERFGNPGGHLKSQQSSRKEYAFDIAFPPEASQDEVYTRTVKDLMPTIVDGYNATIFAYGATGAGKTHTMMGSEREGLSMSHNHYQECEARQVDGIIPHALTDIFRLIDKRKKEETIRSLVDGSMYDWKVFISYLEVYNEQIRDLLQPSDRPLSLREDQARNIVHVAGLHQEIAHNVDEVLDLLRR
jgi:kinesin family protein 18/19